MPESPPRSGPGRLRLTWIDEADGVVEAEAGIHLGADPYDPVGVATLENSLLYQLFQKGWGLNDLGGITHQTVSGFLSTGSAGGSLRFDLDNVVDVRMVDGTGAASWIERDDPVFDAAAVSMGLLGVVTKVRLRFNRTFVIDGNEVTTPTTGPDCPIALFGPGTGTTPSAFPGDHGLQPGPLVAATQGRARRDLAGDPAGGATAARA